MKARIAVIEDELSVSEEYAGLIKAAWADVEVVRAYDEESGRKLLQEGEFDVITLDMALQGGASGNDIGGGMRLLGEMGLAQRATVIVVSGNVDDTMKQCLSGLRVNDILRKPHKVHEYLSVVRMGLEVQGKVSTQAGGLSGQVRIGKLLFDPLIGSPKWDGREIRGCTLTQQRLLHRLASANGAPVALRKLGLALPSMKPTDEAIRVHVSELRKLLGKV